MYGVRNLGCDLPTWPGLLSTLGRTDSHVDREGFFAQCSPAMRTHRPKSLRGEIELRCEWIQGIFLIDSTLGCSGGQGPRRWTGGHRINHIGKGVAYILARASPLCTTLIDKTDPKSSEIYAGGQAVILAWRIPVVRVDRWRWGGISLHEGSIWRVLQESWGHRVSLWRVRSSVHARWKGGSFEPATGSDRCLPWSIGGHRRVWLPWVNRHRVIQHELSGFNWRWTQWR